MEKVIRGFGKVRSDFKKVTFEIQEFNPLASEKETDMVVKRAVWNEQVTLNARVLNSKRNGLK